MYDHLLTSEENRLFQQVLCYIEETYSPAKNLYEDKFDLLSCHKDLVEEDPFETIFVHDPPGRRRPREMPRRKNQFCQIMLAYFDGGLDQLKACCKKAQLSAHAFGKLCEGTFSPSKAAVCRLIIAAQIDYTTACQLLQATGISLHPYNLFDVVMTFFFRKEIHDFTIISKVLYLLELPMLGYDFV